MIIGKLIFRFKKIFVLKGNVFFSSNMIKLIYFSIKKSNKLFFATFESDLKISADIGYKIKWKSKLIEEILLMKDRESCAIYIP